MVRFIPRCQLFSDNQSRRLFQNRITDIRQLQLKFVRKMSPDIKIRAKDDVGGAGAVGTYRSAEEDDDCVRIRWDQPIV